jgi:hypothetical protein
VKPVVVITVYRRYHELAAAIERIKELAGEFEETPEIVVVWAQPEVGRLWLFQQLLESGAISCVLGRPRLPEESPERSTTYPESHNIRLGLNWVRDNYDPDTTYAVVMSADVYPNPHQAFQFIDEHMSREKGRAVVFHWPNGCVPVNIWHTNFFAVCLDEKYWPPVVEPGREDTLELAWGKQLAQRRLDAVLESHNSRDKRFVHTHQSEHLAEWPIIPQSIPHTALLLISGHLPWWRRLLERLHVLKPFRRPQS